MMTHLDETINFMTNNQLSFPNNSIQISPKEKGYTPIALRNSKNGLIGKTPTGYELIFLYDKMQYNVKLYCVNDHYKPSKKELVEVVDSMFPNK